MAGHELYGDCGADGSYAGRCLGAVVSTSQVPFRGFVWAWIVFVALTGGVLVWGLERGEESRPSLWASERSEKMTVGIAESEEVR